MVGVRVRLAPMLLSLCDGPGAQHEPSRHAGSKARLLGVRLKIFQMRQEFFLVCPALEIQADHLVSPERWLQKGKDAAAGLRRDAQLFSTAPATACLVTDLPVHEHQSTPAVQWRP